MKSKHSPFLGMAREELADLVVGIRIKKLSGKPFSNGRKTDIVIGVVAHPHREGKLAFLLADSKVVSPENCTWYYSGEER